MHAGCCKNNVNVYKIRSPVRKPIPLSYTILLERVLAEKKCPQKHGGFSPEMTPLPWLLVPPAHEKTTDQAQN